MANAPQTASTANYKLPETHKPFRSWLRAMALLAGFVVVLETVLSSWAAWKLSHLAGQWFAELGSPLLTVGGIPLMSPFAWLSWDSRLGEVPAFTSTFLVLNLSLVCLVPVLYLVLVANNRHTYKAADIHGSARWATEDDIRRTGLLG